MRTQAVFKALSDPTRREILKLLQEGSRTAGELAERFPIAKASLSHHLSVLKMAELVRSERRGQFIVYSLDSTVFQEMAMYLIEFFQAHRPVRRRP